MSTTKCAYPSLQALDENVALLRWWVLGAIVSKRAGGMQMDLQKIRNMPVSAQQRQIVHMSRESVPVATCLRRLANWCLSNWQR